MKLNEDFFLNYLSQVPLALAFERINECKQYRQQVFAKPILDIGCGDGQFANILFNEKIDTRVDPDPLELELARRLNCYHELIQCPGDSIPKPDSFYKTIISNSAIEHIPALEPVLLEANRLLAPGGTFMFTVPSNFFDHYSITNLILTFLGFSSLAQKYRIFFNSFWKHFHYFPRQEWEDIARRCGFEVLYSQTFNSKYFCLLNNFLVPFSFPSYICKKLFKRWILFPKMRRFLIYPIYLLTRDLFNQSEKTDQGGLVFLSLIKK